MDTIETCLRGRFGDIRPRRATFSGTNLIYILEGTTPPRVAKIAGLQPDDITNEYHCLRRMEGTGLVPRPESLTWEPGLGPQGGATVLIMEARPGRNLLERILELGQDDWRAALPYYRQLGGWLAAIHAQRYEEGTGIRPSELGRVRAGMAAVAFVPAEVAAQSSEALARIEERPADWVLTHRDYAAHNILLSEAGEATVIDWEFGEWSDPLSDVANVHFWTHLHFPETAGERSRAFLEGYRERRPLAFSRESLYNYCIYRIWVILLRISTVPDHVHAEWVRRLRWALQRDFTS